MRDQAEDGMRPDYPFLGKAVISSGVLRHDTITFIDNWCATSPVYKRYTGNLPVPPGIL